MTSALMANYGHPELQFARGQGVYLYTADNERYVDFTMGIAVNCLGHCHPHLIAALKKQADTLWHTSNLFSIEPTERLAKRLVELTFADRVFFANSGTEAVECGFKMMRRYHYHHGRKQRVRIISLTQSFHGRTLAPVAACLNPVHIEGFLVGDAGFDQVPFGDLDALRAAISENTAGIILEPVQGEGGIRAVPVEYLQAVRQICDEHGILLMFDEVQSGVGRTGYLFAHEVLGVEPDLLASAKGLGGGFPIGACLSKEHVAEVMTAGTHGSTFGGNPLATAVANAVLDVLTAPGFLVQVNERATQLRAGIDELTARYPAVLAGHTGLGLMVGLRCAGSNADLLKAMAKYKLLAVKAGGNSVRLLPPLNISAAEVDEGLELLAAACADLS
ncbi:aspartate aminotransferase family protein [Pseudohongiella sp.]|uniref:Acetylornithine transaminase n=1 Tax=marine sediment metagenome TaxID=412755 RepID=A0A0F9WH72_9ZZZZ|nr:aspartate aminotransferase family protein [Pseudohongiella sp.]HDZ08969.1 aspartate aminotransferase family protein [Pseudohongiella sp.]HEA62654.1 aspartate aminotransferase family protein [Pseudohongiella sp.]